MIVKFNYLLLFMIVLQGCSGLNVFNSIIKLPHPKYDIAPLKEQEIMGIVNANNNVIIMVTFKDEYKIRVFPLSFNKPTPKEIIKLHSLKGFSQELDAINALLLEYPPARLFSDALYKGTESDQDEQEKKIESIQGYDEPHQGSIIQMELMNNSPINIRNFVLALQKLSSVRNVYLQTYAI